MTGESENKSDFSCDISIGDDFIFRVKHSEDKRNTSDKDEMRKKKKPRNKYISPSTKRRNAARLLAYKAKRAEMGGKGPTRSGDPLPPLTWMLQVGSTRWGQDWAWPAGSRI